MKTAEYITRPGDRWDLISYKAYGTVANVTLEDGTIVNAMSYILRNNPDMKADSIITEGLLLQIPIIPTTSVKTDDSLLPPWKRS